jgi:hypothetical protein
LVAAMINRTGGVIHMNDKASIRAARWEFFQTILIVYCTLFAVRVGSAWWRGTLDGDYLLHRFAILLGTLIVLALFAFVFMPTRWLRRDDERDNAVPV